MHGVDQDADASSVTTQLERFTCASDDEVKTLILNSSDKSCDHDPVPIWLLKLCVDDLLRIITGRVTVSVTLDLSAAFDTLDHGILLRTLGWISSYLHDRYIR